MELPGNESGIDDPLLTDRRVYINGGYEEIPVYDRTLLGAGFDLTGPAILEDPTATIGNIVIRSVKA